MNITCHSCSACFTPDHSDVSAGAGTVRCSHCGSMVNMQHCVAELAASVGTVAAEPVSGAPDDMMRLLAGFLRNAVLTTHERGAGGNRWETRRAIVCVQPELCEQVRRILEAKGFEVFVAPDGTEAIRYMREERTEVVVIAPEFDAVEQGALFVVREISALRMPERRRLFVVQISTTARTADAHAAFIASVNLVVNTAELDRLPVAFDRSERAFKELYYDFNRATQAAARLS